MGTIHYQAGDTKEPGGADSMPGYTIDQVDLDGRGDHWSKITVWGDEPLRDLIVDLLNEHRELEEDILDGLDDDDVDDDDDDISSLDELNDALDQLVDAAIEIGHDGVNANLITKIALLRQLVTLRVVGAE